jgi:hypothetical protein
VTGPSGRWDPVALRAGALVSLVFAVPLSVGASWAASAGNTSLAVWLSLGAVAGFGIGAGCAAWVQRIGLPISHGIATAAGTYIAAQTAFIAVEVATGDEVNWFGAMFNLSVVMGIGLLGGLVGRRLRNQGVLPSIERGRR